MTISQQTERLIVGWAGGFAHRLHHHIIPRGQKSVIRHLVARGHEKHVPTLPGSTLCNANPMPDGIFIPSATFGHGRDAIHRTKRSRRGECPVQPRTHLAANGEQASAVTDWGIN